MKNTLVLFSLIFLCINVAYGQKLGHSSLSPYAGSVEQNSHTIYQNIGEAFNAKSDLDDIISFDGLLHNVSNDQFAIYFIQVRYFYDENENGLRDSDEHLMALGSFSIQDTAIFINHEKQGVSLQAKQGSYTINYNGIGLEDWNLTTQSDHEFELNEVNKSKVIEFGLYPEVFESNLVVSFVSDPFRCGFPIEGKMCVSNQGYVIETGVVWIDIDDRIDGIYFEEEPDYIIDDTYVGYDIELLPTEKFTINYGLTVPLIDNASQLGEIYTTLGIVDTEFTFVRQEFEQELRCSYDPNDKLVSPDRPDSLGLLDQPITYTIRFQNTGNDYALNVVVRDTLSDHLNVNSFRLIDTSHPDELSVVFDPDNNQIVHFEFDNIYLPDSTTNEAGSNGHIMYQISAKDGTSLNTEINNTGHIYFDFNPAIVTNVTSTTLVDTFPVIVAVEDSFLEEQISVFPNPTKGLVQFDRKVDLVRVRDLYGRIVFTGKGTSKIDLVKLPSASYVLEIFIDEQRIAKKIILMD